MGTGKLVKRPKKIVNETLRDENKSVNFHRKAETDGDFFGDAHHLLSVYLYFFSQMYGASRGKKPPPKILRRNVSTLRK